MFFSKRTLVLGLVGFGLLPSAKAATDLHGVTYTIEPIIGYELQKKENPARTKAELTYGARVIAGYKIISLEGEYTVGNSDENFFSPAEEIKEKTEKMRVGLRSTYALGSMLDWTLRGGAEAQKIHTTTIVSGTSTESNSPTYVYPYVGSELEIALGSTLSLNGGVVATLKDLKDLKKTEYTTTFGIKIALNTSR